MIIRIDDSVFTVDESEAYTILRLIKKVLIPKQESLDADVSAIGTKANEALNKGAVNSEAIEAIEDELEGLNETTIPDIKDDIASLYTSTDLVGGQVTALQGDIDHLITEDIPMINNDIIALGQDLNNKVDKLTKRVESWQVVKSLSGLEETVIGTIDVIVSEINNVVFFSSLYLGPFSWDPEGEVPGNFAVKIPDTSVSGIMVNGCIGGTDRVTYRFARLENDNNRYIVVASNDEVVAGWYGNGIISTTTLTGTSYHFSGFYIKGV